MFMFEILWERNVSTKNEIIICVIMTFISTQQAIMLYVKMIQVYYVMLCFVLLLIFIVLRTLFCWNRILFNHDIPNKLNLLCGTTTFVIYVILSSPILLNIFSYVRTDNCAIYGTNNFGGKVSYRELVLVHGGKVITFSIKEKCYFLLQFFLSARKMFTTLWIYKNEILRDNILTLVVLHIKRVYSLLSSYIIHRQIKRCLLH